MVIKLPINYEGSKGTEELVSKFDSGLVYSCIDLRKAELLGTVESLKEPISIKTLIKDHFIEATKVIRLDFYIDGIRLSDEFLVISYLAEEAIIGAATMQKWRIKLDFEHDTVIVDPAVAKLILI